MDSTEKAENEETADIADEVVVKKRVVFIPDNPFPDEPVDAYAPLNYSWVVPHKIAAMALPRNRENVQFLVNEGITHIVTLSEGKAPPVADFSVRWTEIPVPEFELPTLEQIDKFMELCKDAEAYDEVIGVHCRQGRSRCGVMLACYLMHQLRLSPQQAEYAIKEIRPGSLEAQDHLDRVHEYYKRIQTDDIQYGVSAECLQRIIDDARSARPEM